MPDEAIKDERSKLLRAIPMDIHTYMFKKLEELRLAHEGYRDDQLLMYLWGQDLRRTWSQYDGR